MIAAYAMALSPAASEVDKVKVNDMLQRTAVTRHFTIQIRITSVS